jgi:hypothetical protein
VRKGIFASVNLLFLLLVADTFASSCLEYEPAVVTLTGTIVQQTYPGPPNYEDNYKGEELERVWTLILNKAICLKASTGLNEAATNIREIQLIFKLDQYSRLSVLDEAKVMVSGTLFHKHSGHHHTRVLLNATEIKELEKKK